LAKARTVSTTQQGRKIASKQRVRSATAANLLVRSARTMPTALTTITAQICRNNGKPSRRSVSSLIRTGAGRRGCTITAWVKDPWSSASRTDGASACAPRVRSHTIVKSRLGKGNNIYVRCSPLLRQGNRRVSLIERCQPNRAPCVSIDIFQSYLHVFNAPFRVFIYFLSCLARWRELVELCSALQKAKGKNQNSKRYTEKYHRGFVGQLSRLIT